MDNETMIDAVCLIISCKYNDDKLHTFRFLVSESESTNIIAYVVSLLPVEPVSSLNIDKEEVGLVGSSSLCDREFIGNIINKEFNNNMVLKLEKRDK